VLEQAAALRRSRPGRAIVCAALLLAAWVPRAEAQVRDLWVLGAASLKGAIDDANAQYERRTGRKVAAAYAGSALLAKQIESGTPADIFISADLDWMDYLARRGLIKPGTRSNLLGNKLVLVARAGSAPVLAIGPNFPLARALGDGSLAMADPSSVPAGKYGKAALEALGPRSRAGSHRRAMSGPRSPWYRAGRHRSASFTAAMRSPTGAWRSSERFRPPRIRRSSIRWR
jgi:molybdate transport system substrate-binding protein